MFPFYEAGGATGVKLARVVAKSLLRVYNEFAKRDGDSISKKRSRYPLSVLAKPKKDSRIQWASVNPTQLITTDIPKLVIRLLKSQVRHDDAPVSAVSVISSMPVEAILNERGALPSPDEELPIFRGLKRRERDFWRISW